MTTTIDFEALASQSGQGLGSYSEDGFTITPVSSSFYVSGPSYPWYGGSTGIFNNFSEAESVITKVGGGSFNLDSIQLDGLYGPENSSIGGTTVTFIGRHADGTTAVQSFTTDDIRGYETFSFIDAFNDVVSVSWRQTHPYNQFDNISLDNIVIVPNRPPMANPDVGVIGENDAAKLFDVLANDTDPDNDALTLSPTLGTISVTSSNAAVNGINASAAAMVLSGQIEFTPGTLFDSLKAGESATVVVNYMASDADSASGSSTLTVTVNGLNDDPTAVNDAWGPVIEEDTEVVISSATLLGNDTDVDHGDTKSIVSVSATSAKGSAVTMDALTGEVVYVANSSSFDSLGVGNQTTDTFTYTMKDGAGVTSTAAVTVTVQGAADGANIYGTVNPDTLTGDSANQQIEASNGNDIVRAGGGIDRLMGQNGDDQLYGEDGNDFLWGDRGNDLLDGGRHNDIYTGGLGNDIYRFGASSGNDTIKDFKPGNDRVAFVDGVTLIDRQFGDFNGDGVQDSKLVVGIGGVQSGTILIEGIGSATSNSDIFA